MYLETPRLAIREFRLADRDELWAILGDSKAMEYLEPPFTLERTEEFLREFCIARQGALAAEEKATGKVIGYLLFNAVEENVRELGWVFHPTRWRQGYAYEACTALFDYAFTKLAVHKIFAETIDPVRAVGLLEKLGMKREGVQQGQVKDAEGRWADVYLYGLLREEYKP